MTAPTVPTVHTAPSPRSPRPPRSGDGRPGSPDLLRSVFRQHAAGVAVITALHGAQPVGFTATSLNSVSADPPLLSFTIGTGASSWPGVRDSEYLGVHILGEHQRELAGLFARSGADRFGPATGWNAGPHGVPVLDGVLAWLVCRVVARVPAGEHRVIIAEAVAGDPAGEGRPLLYHQGRFNALRD
ncbi:flavin reductase family protein [Streptomyces sp. NBC_00207]|uniref:flavin reductase family protein n=1 Tax=unclassified Streptomyces TaxID=2593676 RepID=UPI0028856B65|nr:flavin reductase family protein [Streptomyces sp. DSM 41633]